IGDEGGRRGVAFRRQLRAPDRGLRLGLTGQAAKQLGAHRTGFRFGTGAIQVGGALLLRPACERIHVASAKAARSASMRARLTPKSRRPSRDAERTWMTCAAASTCTSRSSTKPIILD